MPEGEERLMTADFEVDKFALELESLGVDDVREKLKRGHWMPFVAAYAENWLQLEEKKRADISASRAEVRDEESLSISRKALDKSAEANLIASKALESSRFANRMAICAIILSIAMAILEIIKWHSSK
jgi:hypothetical protein